MSFHLCGICDHILQIVNLISRRTLADCAIFCPIYDCANIVLDIVYTSQYQPFARKFVLIICFYVKRPFGDFGIHRL